MIERIGTAAITALLVATLAILWTGPQGHHAQPLRAVTVAATLPADVARDAPEPATSTNAQTEVAGPPESVEVARETIPIAAPTPAHADGAVYTCWNSYGMPIPQTQPTCPPGWSGSPPESSRTLITTVAPWTPALTGPQAAALVIAAGQTIPGGNIPQPTAVYQCWNAYGGPLPQASAVCPVGWAGRPPEYPVTVGTVWVP